MTHCPHASRLPPYISRLAPSLTPPLSPPLQRPLVFSCLWFSLSLSPPHSPSIIKSFYRRIHLHSYSLAHPPLSINYTLPSMLLLFSVFLPIIKSLSTHFNLHLLFSLPRHFFFLLNTLTSSAFTGSPPLTIFLSLNKPLPLLSAVSALWDLRFFCYSFPPSALTSSAFAISCPSDILFLPFNTALTLLSNELSAPLHPPDLSFLSFFHFII